MLIYNAQPSFGGQHKSADRFGDDGIYSSTVGRATSIAAKNPPQCSKRKLTNKNVHFLKSLGFKVKKN